MPDPYVDQVRDAEIAALKNVVSALLAYEIKRNGLAVGEWIIKTAETAAFAPPGDAEMPAPFSPEHKRAVIERVKGLVTFASDLASKPNHRS